MLHDKHFPNESSEYRDARDQLLHEEIELRRQYERVAQHRRELPLGGKLKEDYFFEELAHGETAKVKFSQLFEEDKPSLVVYSMMYHPNDEKACPSCTSILDGVDGSTPHIRDRVNFVVVTKAPIEKAMKWAAYRGWKSLRILSSFNNTYNHDYFAETENGAQIPAANVFSKKPDGIYHTYSTELLYAPADPGQNHRHVDHLWPVWNMLDMTPEGRGADWYPKHEYK
jgi:predicted dithiol-disulfide oxidoreductase (DUF899 family)